MPDEPIVVADGLEAASMRRIAAELGTGAMSLYRYVPSRDDLLELMVDHVLLEMRIPARPSGDWRADLTLYAERTRRVRLRHPWTAGRVRMRADIGPNRLRLLEFTFGALDVGIPIDDAFTLLEMLNGYVDRAVSNELEWAARLRRDGTTPEQLMMRAGPYVRELLKTGEYPMFERIVKEARTPHMSAEEQFQQGLRRVLDCIAGALPPGDPSP